MPEIDQFLVELASGSPVPGGGSVAGFEVAMGAALIHMVAELTLGREKFASVEQQVETIRDRAGALQSQARDLVDGDGEAFARVAEALKLSRGTDDEKAVRRDAVQRALKGAVDPPLATMRAAHEVIRIAAELAPIGNPNAISDVGSGALAAAAGYLAAKLNVEINLAAIRDEHFVHDIRAQMPDDAIVDQSRDQILELVLRSIRGE